MRKDAHKAHAFMLMFAVYWVEYAEGLFFINRLTLDV